MMIAVLPDRNDGPAVERRASPRHVIQHRVQWRTLVDAAGPSCIATTDDISADGVRLVLQHWVAVGSTLAVTLLDANDDVGIFNLVRVTRILRQDGTSWSVAGTFVRKIGEEDFQALLKRTALVAPQLPGVPNEHYLQQSCESCAEADQTDGIRSTAPQPDPVPGKKTGVSALTRATIPEERKRQILEQIRERLQRSKIAADSSDANLQS